ncbi:MAG: thioredoxin family protein [Candidatus Andersenbacteria bacterium]|nr:thioredoxin family protein [Candidatus Andersenbacteria bacterium]
MINTKSKIAIFVLIIGIIIISGWWIWNNFKTEEKDIATVTPIIESENYIAISHSEKDGESILLFDVNIQEYLVESADLSKLSEEDLLKYKKLGSEFIVPPKFDYTSGFSLLEIKTGSDSLECKPTIPYLEIEMVLPPDSEARGELLGFVEDRMEEKIEIMPLTTCSSYGCSDCPNYTKENDFFPIDISIRVDVRSLQEETLVRVYLPLLRHNPAIRETHIIKEARIKIAYELNKYNTLLFEEENVPDRVDMPKFNVSYKITNPSATEFDNLKIKADIRTATDDRAVVNFSERFSIKGYESKIISFQVDSTQYLGGFFMFPYIVKDDEVIIIGQRESIWFSQEAARAEKCEPLGITNLTYQNLKEETSSGLWLVYFWEKNENCCELMSSVEGLAEEMNEINFGEINSFEYYKKYNVYGVPTFILFKDGQEIDRKVGVYSKEDLKIWLESQVK